MVRRRPDPSSNQASPVSVETTYYLNGHNFIENELNREHVSFRKSDNAFLAVADPQALQAAADRFSPDLIRKRLECASAQP